MPCVEITKAVPGWSSPWKVGSVVQVNQETADKIVAQGFGKITSSTVTPHASHSHRRQATPDSLGGRLRIARHKLGWTVNQAAQLLGMDERGLRNAESGTRRRVPQEAVEWIERVLAGEETAPSPLFKRRRRG